MPIDYLAINTGLRDQLITSGLVGTEAECRKFPGAGWLYETVRWAADQGVTILSGEEGLELIQNGINPSHIAWIQESLEHESVFRAWLSHPGAEDNTILFNLESPLFAPIFWDIADTLPAKFRMGLGIPGVRPSFPAYRAQDIRHPDPQAWAHNKYAVGAVLSNKWNALAPNPQLLIASPSYRSAIAGEQQSVRVRTLEQLSLARPVFVAGHGWKNPDPLALQAFIKTPILPVENKLAYLNQFIQSVAVENTTHPGYWSEKTWDSWTAGSHPISDDCRISSTESVLDAIKRTQHAMRETADTHPASELRWVNSVKLALEQMDAPSCGAW